MITLTRSGTEGSRLTLNSDLIERIEEVPDTVITLIDGKHYRVQESVSEIVEAVLAFRAAIVEHAALPETASQARNLRRLSAVRDDHSYTSQPTPGGTATTSEAI